MLVIVCGAATLAPSLRELLSEARLREWTVLKWYLPMGIAVPVGVAFQATRSEPLNCLSENQIPAMQRRIMNS